MNKNNEIVGVVMGLNQGFELLKYHPRLSTVPYASKAYFDMILPVHLDQSTDQASRRSVTMAHILERIKEAGVLFAGASILELHSGPSCSMNLQGLKVNKYLGIELNRWLVDYANTNSNSNPIFTWQAGDSLEYLRANSDNLKWDFIFVFYEVLNTYPEKVLRELIRNIKKSLNPGGLVIGDIRTSEDDFQKYELVITYEGNHLLLEESGSTHAPNLVIRRKHKFKNTGEMILEEHNCLRIISPTELDLAFELEGFKKKWSDNLLVELDTDVFESKNNFFFIYEISHDA